MVEKKKKKRRRRRKRHKGASRVSPHTQAHRGEEATWPPCVMPEERELKFLSRLSCAGMVHTSKHPLPPRRQARGRCTHPWYVRTRGMRGNRRLLSFGNLAPGKHRRDDGSPRPERVHGHAQRRNTTFSRRRNVTGMKGAVRFYSVVRSQTKVMREREN